MSAVTYRVTDAYGNTLRIGATGTDFPDPVTVDRVAGERLYFRVDGEWTESGAYAGPDAIEQQPRCVCGRPWDEHTHYRGLHDPPIEEKCPDGNAPPQPEARTRQDWPRTTSAERRAARRAPLRAAYAAIHSDAARASVLWDALNAVYDDREAAYGHPRDDFARIAALWNGYFDARAPKSRDVDAVDVACMMALLKMARLLESPTHRDSWVDIAGYAAAGARAVGVDK